ncbi:MAG TPA: hypothetical protein VK859_17080 [bacterium]|nr:hypothetical protein [bacterium]
MAQKEGNFNSFLHAFEESGKLPLFIKLFVSEGYGLYLFKVGHEKSVSKIDANQIGTFPDQVCICFIGAYCRNAHSGGLNGRPAPA